MKVLGIGAYGKVLLVKKDQEIYAMKVIKKSRIKTVKQRERTRAERNILEKIRHPFIMNLNYAFQTEDKLFMVIDYCAGGELFFHLQVFQRFNEKVARFYASCILSALQQLHRENIIYRDLKPENILIDQHGYPIITDFGLCKGNLSREERTTSFCGTAEYMAPEIVLKQPYTRSVDWWSFGALVYEMVTGLPPFYTQNKEKLFQRIAYSDLAMPKELSDSCKDLLSRLLMKDSEMRLGSGPGDAQDIIDHPWFQGMNWDKLILRKVKPPFVPKLKDKTDLNYFAKEFTQMPANSESGRSGNLEEKQSAWEGFSFANSDLK